MYFNIRSEAVLKVPSLYLEFITLKKSNEVTFRRCFVSFNTKFHIFKTKSMAIELVNQ